jgi:tetratricopeptide (TPR) repeat protein
MLRSLALVDMIEGRYLNARPRLEESILLSETQQNPTRLARGHLFAAILSRATGDRAGEIRELERAARELTPKSPVFLRCRVGAYFARAGSVERAERLARELRPQVDPGNVQDASHLSLLEGELALARGALPRALELLSRSDREFRTPETLASLADAHRRAGNNPQAIEYYEKLIAEASAALGWEAQQSWIEAHASLAELYLGGGQNDKAAATLDPLERLWANADPGLLLTRRIVLLRNRLRSLGGSNAP